MFRSRKGFVLILAIAMTAVIALLAWAIVNLGCSEALQVRRHNDNEGAYYAAVAGAERMYARIRNISNGSTSITWPLSIASTNIVVGGTTVARYAVSANVTGVANQFMIVSDGTFNNRTVRVTAKYGYTSTYTNGVPFGSIGSMTFRGDRWWFLTSWVYAEGPLQSQSTISPGSNSNSNYVQYSGDIVQNNASLVRPSFWQGAPYDTNADGDYAADVNSDGHVTLDEATAQGKAAQFTADNVNSDQIVDKKDAFIQYYTVTLNNQYNLGIQQGGPNYYSGDQTFGPFAVPAGTKVVFVDGDANIVFNGQQWWGAQSDFAIVATGDITIVQPVNGSNDRLTLIALGDVATGGINLGDIADVDGNLIIYAGDDFEAILGGTTNGSIFADDHIAVDTGLPSFLFNRDFNKGTDDWSNPANRPLVLPPSFGVVSLPFAIKAENLGVNGYKPRWQRR